MFKDLRNKVRLITSAIFLLAIIFSMNAFIFSIAIPPVYGQTANAWNLQRSGAGNELNFFYNNGSNQPAALQLHPGGTARIRSLIDLENTSRIVDPSGTTSLTTLNVAGTTTLTTLNVTGQGKLNIHSNLDTAGDNGLRLCNLTTGDTNCSHFHYGATKDIYIRSGASTGMIALQDTGGNVGIGTASPAQKLDVNGTIRAVGGLDLPTNGTQIAFPNFATNTYTSFYGLSSAGNGNMADGVPWYFGIGREPGNWGEPYRNLIINNHTGVALSSHGGFAQGGVSIWEEVNPQGVWVSKGKEIARFKHDEHGGSVINGRLRIGNFYNGDSLHILQPQDDSIGIQTSLNSNPPGTYAEDNYRLILQPQGGYVGIGTNTPTYKLHVQGSAYIAGPTTVAGLITQTLPALSNIQQYCRDGNNGTMGSCGSDRRLKEDIKPLNIDALSLINKLKPSTFKFKAGGGYQSGFIAQDVLEVIPEAVIEGSNGMYGMNDFIFTPYLVKASQELNAKNQELQDQVSDQQKQINDLKVMVEKLESKVNER